MSKVLRHLPELEGEEQVYVARLFKDLSDAQAQEFASIYRARRKDPTHILLMALLGFVVIAGVHRFYLEEFGMGLLYLFTGGFCLIGTIIDLVNYKDLTFRYNRRVADEVAGLVRGAYPNDGDDFA